MEPNPHKSNQQSFCIRKVCRSKNWVICFPSLSEEREGYCMTPMQWGSWKNSWSAKCSMHIAHTIISKKIHIIGKCGFNNWWRHRHRHKAARKQHYGSKYKPRSKQIQMMAQQVTYVLGKVANHHALTIVSTPDSREGDHVVCHTKMALETACLAKARRRFTQANDTRLWHDFNVNTCF